MTERQPDVTSPTQPAPSLAPESRTLQTVGSDAPPLPPGTVPESGTPPATGTLPETTPPTHSHAPTRAPTSYVIERELGRGGMGVVYLARSLTLQRPCALKMILAGVHSSQRDIQRFRSEAQAVARLQHPGIVQVFEIGEHDGKPFMALEYCAGGSLDALLAKNPLPAKEAASLVQSLAQAIQVAHDAKVIHRDLKPANVLLTDKREPKISDFGLAKKLDEEGATRTGSVMGTPSYMPPEQAAGSKEVGPAVDIYALGAILYECLTGRPPFKAATTMETLRQVLTDEPVSLRALNAMVPADLETIVHKCLQKEPGKRYASAQALADDLGRWLKDEPIQARPVGLLERAIKWVRRHAIISALLAVVLLVVTTGVVASWILTGWALSEKGKADEEATAARTAEEEARTQTVRAEDQLCRSEWAVYAGKLALAQAAFNEHNVPEAFRHLNECRWDLRGWEHAHLRRRFDASKQTLTGHTATVGIARFSPDGKRILTGSWDQTARVWDAENGNLLLTLRGHTDGVLSACFSPDGKRILTGSADKTARIWDAQKGVSLLTLRDQFNGITCVAFSPDGKRVLTGSGDVTGSFAPGEAKVWDADKGTALFTLKGQKDDVTSACFSLDGKRILTGSGSIVNDPDKPGEAKVWDATQGTELFAIRGHRGIVSGVCFSPDGMHILTGGDRTARVWDAGKGTELLTIEGHTNRVNSVCFSPDGKRVLTGSEDSTVRFWDAQRGVELLALKGHTEGVSSVAFSPDGTRILTASGDKTARVWDADQNAAILSLDGHTSIVNSVAYSRDGRRILTGSWDNTARVWDAEKATELRTLRGHTDRVSSVAFSPDGKRILTGSADSTAKLWDAEKGTELRTLKGHTRSVSRVTFSPDGKRILTAGVDNTVRGWDAEKGTELFALKGHMEGVTSAVFSPDGTRILIGGGTFPKPGEATVCDAATGGEVLVLKGHTDRVTCVAFSPNGKHVLTGSNDKSARMWDAETGKELLTLKGHKQEVVSVCFSPDGKRILTGSFDKTVRAWEAEKGTELLVLRGHEGQVYDVCFSPDGKRILIGSGSFGKPGGAKIWDTEKRPELLALKIDPEPVMTVGFSPDGNRVFGWDSTGKVLAWSVVDGKLVSADNPPPKPAPGPAVSPDGRLSAVAEDAVVRITDLRDPPTARDAWPLPDVAERRLYHTEQADAAEKAGQWFAVAFHVGRLLLNDPDNTDLKKQREQAIQKHAAK